MRHSKDYRTRNIGDRCAQQVDTYANQEGWYEKRVRGLDASEEREV